MLTIADAHRLRFDSLLDNPHQIRPPSRLLLAHLPEVDDVAMVGVRRAVVDLLAADVREDPLRVARVLGDQFLHRDRPLARPRQFVGPRLVIGLATPFLSVSSNVKPMPRTIAALEALAGVGLEPGRVVVAAGVEEVGGDQARRSRPSRSNGPASGPLWTWTTLTTTAASPGHFSRLRAA